MNEIYMFFYISGLGPIKMMTFGKMRKKKSKIVLISYIDEFCTYTFGCSDIFCILMNMIIWYKKQAQKWVTKIVTRNCFLRKRSPIIIESKLVRLAIWKSDFLLLDFVIPFEKCSFLVQSWPNVHFSCFLIAVHWFHAASLNQC